VCAPLLLRHQYTKIGRTP